MLQEDSNFIDLSEKLNNNNKKKCKISNFIKDILIVAGPLIIVIGGIILICYLI
jgi:hypothetical protein